MVFHELWFHLHHVWCNQQITSLHNIKPNKKFKKKPEKLYYPKPYFTHPLKKIEQGFLPHKLFLNFFQEKIPFIQKKKGGVLYRKPISMKPGPKINAENIQLTGLLSNQSTIPFSNDIQILVEII